VLGFGCAGVWLESGYGPAYNTESVLEGIARSINYGFEVLGRSLPGLVFGLLKLNAVLLFLWYLFAFASEDWDIGRLPNQMALLSAVIFLVFALWIFIQSFVTELTGPVRTLPRKNGWFFLILVAAPILAVAVVRLFYAGHHNFGSKLLNGTETQIERLYAAFR